MMTDHTAHADLTSDMLAGTLVLRVGYRGEGFAGYAEQPGRRTVAGELRSAFETFLRRDVTLACAGRTDAGVHAVAQHVSVPVTADELLIRAPRLLGSLTALTPDDISVRAAYRAATGFSARFDAVERRYRYRIACGARPVHGWGHVWWLRKSRDLDVGAMRTAAARMLGEHDFASFCKAASADAIRADGRSTCRNVAELTVNRDVECGDELVVIDVAANAFLHNMVRVIVGTLVEIGRGALGADAIDAMLAARRRSAAGPTAPAAGLTLQGVRYPEGSLVLWDAAAPSIGDHRA